MAQKAKLNEILSFLKSRGVALEDEAIRHLADRLDEEPISKETLAKSKMFVKNNLLKQVVELAFIERVKKIKAISDAHPVLQAMEGLRKNNLTPTVKIVPLPEDLRKIFYDDTKWVPYFTFMGLKKGLVVKVNDVVSSKKYIGFLSYSGSSFSLRTTSRIFDPESSEDIKMYRLKDGLFEYEKAEIQKLEKAFVEYIDLHYI